MKNGSPAICLHFSIPFFYKIGGVSQGGGHLFFTIHVFRKKMQKKRFFFVLALDLHPKSSTLISMTMINEYTVTYELSDGHGNVLNGGMSFPKSREGLTEAYEYANASGGWWEIWHGDELVDTLGDVLQRQMD